MCGGPAGFACTDTQTDALNCGNCGRACGSGEICTTGYCHPACNAGESLCVGALGPVCSTLQTDGQNCGACGNVCRTDEVCTAGACELACPPGTSCTPLGGPASLVTDLDAAVVQVPAGRAPSGFVRAGAFAYFSAEDAENGVELWRTDGTAAGTALVRDINPGQAWSSATGLTAVGGLVYFAANDGTHGVELWRSDGTAAGTWLVRDLWPGDGNSSPQYLTAVADTLYFVASTPEAGPELWRTDGTAAGTVLVKDIRVGSAGSSPASLAALNGVLYFSADDGVVGRELWRTDGTEGGTFLVNDLWPGTIGSSPTTLTVSGDTLVFAARDSSAVVPSGSLAYRLWRSAGTAETTARIGTLVQNGGPSQMVPFQGGVVLSWSEAGETSLYKSDGTSLVRLTTGSVVPARLTAIGGKIFFAGLGTADQATEMGAYDGTAVTRIDLYPGTPAAIPSPFADAGGVAVFTARDASGVWLWRSDGTVAGTTHVTAAPAATTAGSLNGTALLSTPSDATHAPSVIASDGTEGGTRWLPVRSNDRASISGSLCAAAGGILFFADDGVTGTNLWRSDGTGAGTAYVVDLVAGGAAAAAGVIAPLSGGRAFVSQTDGVLGLEPWVTDGTAMGTALLADLAPGAAGSSPSQPLSLGDRVVFFANDGVTGVEPWVTDGTSAGTFQLADLTPGSASSSPSGIGVALGRAWYRLYAYSGSALWVTDGTAAGSAVVVQGDGSPSVSSLGPSVVEVNGVAYYLGWTSATGTELWRTDGTPAGTAVVADIAPGGTSSSVVSMTPYAGALYFGANDGSRTGLWRTDGTGAGTTLVRAIAPATGMNAFGPMAALNGLLLFFADDPAIGWEPWLSDGTAAGTVPFADLLPGASGGALGKEILVVPELGVALFAASNGVNGQELWMTDGTASGTRMVQDIWPGPGSSNPRTLTRVGDRIVFIADDGVHGPELWSMSWVDLALVR